MASYYMVFLGETPSPREENVEVEVEVDSAGIADLLAMGDRREVRMMLDTADGVVGTG
jgi:hypothetical protein